MELAYASRSAFGSYLLLRVSRRCRRRRRRSFTVSVGAWVAASDPDTQSYVIIMVTQQVLKNISYGYNATAAAGCLAAWLVG